jgi:hypothetical protein
MKHLSSILLAAAFVAGSVTACFKDPTSDLMNGPSQITLTRSAITLRTGDSIDVSAELKDDAGNTYGVTDAQWVSADANVAAVRVDTIIIPGDAFSRAIIRGVAAGGGTTTVTVTIRGVSKQFRVLVLPRALGATAAPAVSGTARTDTILITLPGGVIQRDIFTVGDTVTFTVAAGSKVYFSADTMSKVSFGANRAYIVSRTDSTRIKAIARAPFRGRPWVTALHYNGPTEVGTVAIDSLQGDTVVVSRPRYYGTVTQTADTMFLNAQAGSTFATTSAVRFGATAGIVLSRSATAMSVISPALYTGQVTVTNVVVGAATLDSLKSPAAYTINKASFGGTVVTAGRLVDTVKVYGTAVTKFTTTPAGSVSNVTIGGVAAWVILRTADSMYVVAKLPSTGPIAVSNVNVGGTNIPTLNTAGNIVITETPTGEANEPANDTPGAVTINLTGATVTNPVVIYGAVDDAADVDDYFAFTLTAARTVVIQVQFTGTGGGGATNPDIDLYTCNAACSGGYNFAGATGAQPENMTLTTLAAGTYNIVVEAWDTGGTTRPYKLIVY